MNPAAVVFRQINARIIRPTLENQPPPIRRDLCLAIDERLLRHSEEFGDAPDLGIANSYDSVLNPATRPTTLTNKINHFF